MSAANGSAMPGDVTEVTDKGKGKAVDRTPVQDTSMEMDEDDDSSEEESAAEEPEGIEGEEDGLEEIDTANILHERTRRKKIDWAEADQKLKDEGEDEEDDDDDDDDEDFEVPGHEGMHDEMDED